MKKILICLTALTCLQPLPIFAEEEDKKPELIEEVIHSPTYNSEYITRLDFIDELFKQERINCLESTLYFPESFNDITFEYFLRPDNYVDNYQFKLNHTHKLNMLKIAKKAGIVTGYPDGTFRPDSPLTREDMYLTIYRYLTSGKIKIKDGQEIKKPSLKILDKYKDKNELSSWAENGIAVLLEMGIYKVYNDNVLKPKEYITSIEALVIIDDFYKNYFEKYIS